MQQEDKQHLRFLCQFIDFGKLVLQYTLLTLDFTILQKVSLPEIILLFSKKFTYLYSYCNQYLVRRTNFGRIISLLEVSPRYRKFLFEHSLMSTLPVSQWTLCSLFLKVYCWHKALISNKICKSLRHENLSSLLPPFWEMSLKISPFECQLIMQALVCQ